MKVYLIGAGPGDPGLFTLKGKYVLSIADVVVYDYLANDSLLEFAKADAECIYVGKKGGDHTLSQEGINKLIMDKAKEGKIVARLKGGDPYMFGRGGEEAEELLDAGIPFEVVPGVSSAIGGTAYAGIPLTHRDYASSVCFATGHEDPTKAESAHNWKALAEAASTLVFFMGMKNLPEISRKLIDAGMSPSMPAALIRWGTTPQQRVLEATIGTLPNEADRQGFSAPCLIVVGKVVQLRSKLDWFGKKPLLGKGIVVTRAREQASSSAALLTEMGADLIQFPTISINPLSDYEPVREAIRNLQHYSWVLFTSVNGVNYFWKQLGAMGLDSRAIALCKVAAIGPATADILRTKGIEPDFIPEKFVAESIAQGLVDLGVKGKRILLPRALEAREILPEELTKAGADVHVLPVYVSSPNAARRDEVLQGLQDGRIHCITFGSSSTVDNFLQLIPAATLRQYPHVKLAAIGPITAKTLEKHGLPCDIQPKDYTIPALVELLAKTL